MLKAKGGVKTLPDALQVEPHRKFSGFFWSKKAQF